MNNKEKELVCGFMENYSDLLGRNTCNDWTFPDDWTKEERTSFVKRYHDWNGDPEEFDENNLSLPDFAVVDFVFSMLVDDVYD